MNPSKLPSSVFTPAARSVALLIVIAVCLFFIGLGRLPLLEPDEGRNAEVAREMVVTHDWITPHYDGLPYLDKPTVLFWVIAGAFRCFGISGWSARFPVALAALGTVLLAWLTGRRMFGETTGVRAGIILATAPLFFTFARTVIFDMPLTLLLSLALLCFWLNSRMNYSSRWLDALAFAAMAVGALTKGPVAFLLPLITLAVYHLLAGRFRELKQVHWGRGWLVFLVIALPWFIDVSLRNPGFPKYAFWEESLLRFTTGAEMHRSSGVLYYIPVYLAGFFPWSFFLLFVGWKRLKNWRTLRDPAYPAELFLLVWAAVIFVFFTLSHSKLPGYILPALVPLSILMGKAWQNARSTETLSAPGWLAAGFAALALAGLLIAAMAESLQFLRSYVRALTKIPPSVVQILRPSLLHCGVILVALALLGLRGVHRARHKIISWRAFAATALAVPLLAVSLLRPLLSYARVDSSRALAATIEVSRDANLPLYGYYYFRTGLPFYLKRLVGLVTEDGDQTTSNYITRRFALLHNARAARIFSSTSPAPPLLTPGPLITGAELRTLIDTSRRPFLLMLRNDDVANMLGVYPRMEPLWTSWQFTILRVPPGQKQGLGGRRPQEIVKINASGAG